MEPVFMVLGQSAATAACLSLDQQVDVQNVAIPDYHFSSLAELADAVDAGK